MSHINARTCENPDKMLSDRGDCSRYKKANGGRGSIAEQIAESKMDIVLGGGRDHFAVVAETISESVMALAVQSGFTVITDKAQLQASSGGRVLGLFAPEHLPVQLQGTDGRVAEKPSTSFLNSLHWALGEVTLPSPIRCEDNPEFKDTPSLGLMTRRAIDHLAVPDGPGFVLIIESASIDKQSHVRDACGSIGELRQLEEALAASLDFASTSPETLILVTADHGQAAQIVPNGSLFSGIGVPVFTPGSLVRLQMPYGGIMAVNYATNDFFAEEHTGTTVPLYSNRVDVALPSFMTQPDVFHVIHRFLELKPQNTNF